MAQSAAPATSNRNIALDNLRVVAMLLGLVTHGVLPYTATGVAQFPIRDCTRHPAADAVFFAVHDFRMQLFFLLAGFAGTALASRRGAGALARNRLTRVALPLALAALVVSPLMHVLFAAHTTSRGIDWQPAENGGWMGPNFHLWFLYYLLMCCLPLLGLIALAPALPERIIHRVDASIRKLIAQWWALPMLAALAVPVLWDMPAWWIDTPKGWRPSGMIYVYYLGFFLSGALLYRHRDLLPVIGRRWPVQLALANLLILPAMLKLTIAGNWAEETVQGAPGWLVGWKAGAIFLGGLYTWLMLSALLGLFQRYFSGSAAWWRYLADASYWCYLAGFPIQAALQVWLATSPLPILIELLLVNVLTFSVLLLSYEFLVRHSWIGLILNGKRPVRTPRTTPEPVVILARVMLPERKELPRSTSNTPASRAPAPEPVPRRRRLPLFPRIPSAAKR